MQCIAQKLDAFAEYNVILVFTNIKIMYFILGILDNAQYKINYLVCVLILISGAGHYSNSVHKSVTAQSAL